MKFQVGEIVVIAKAMVDPRLVGEECEIVKVGPFRNGDVVILTDGRRFSMASRYVETADYMITFRGDMRFSPESWLRKRRPPIPDEVLTIFQGKPVSGPD